MIDTPTRSARYPQREQERMLERSVKFRITDIARQVPEPTGQRRFLLTTAGGEIRAVIPDGDQSRRRR